LGDFGVINVQTWWLVVVLVVLAAGLFLTGRIDGVRTWRTIPQSRDAWIVFWQHVMEFIVLGAGAYSLAVAPFGSPLPIVVALFATVALLLMMPTLWRMRRVRLIRVALILLLGWFFMSLRPLGV